MEKLLLKLEVPEIIEKRLNHIKNNKVGALLIPIEVPESARIMKIEPNMGEFSIVFNIGKTFKFINYPINHKDCFGVNNSEINYRCLKVKAIKVEDLNEDEIVKITNDILYADIVEDLEDKLMIYTNVIFQGQKIYRDNPYVFYVEVKNIESESQQNMQ